MNQKIEKYLSTLRRSPRTIDTYRWALSYYVVLVGDELSDDAYEKFLVETSRLQMSTLRVLRSAVMGLFEFYDIGDLSRRDKLNRHYTKKAKVKPVSFDRDAIEKIISYCDTLKKDLMELRDRAFVLTMADSGFRISELCSLSRRDIDWLNERVAIVGKGEKPALVRLSKRSLSAMKDYLFSRDKLPWRSEVSEPLFAQHGNVGKLKKMTVDGMRKAIKQRMKEVGVDVRLHDFRHYFVTVTLIATNNLKVAQELARHESTVTTQRYAHFSEHELDATYNSIFNEKDTDNGDVQEQGQNDPS